MPEVISRDSMRERLTLVESLLAHEPGLWSAIRSDLAEHEVRGNIENFVGVVPVPLGLCGPIVVRDMKARGEYVVPMATLEGALVASYSRGAKMMNLSGGCETIVYEDRFLRAVQFTTATLADGLALVEWCRERERLLAGIARVTSKHLEPVGFSYDHIASSVVLSMSFTTGDAMGSNMASKAIGAVGAYVKKHCQFVVEEFLPYPEDKKNIPARMKGKAVIARTTLDARVVAEVGRTDVRRLDRYVRNYKNALALHGSSSLNIHAVNGMAALSRRSARTWPTSASVPRRSWTAPCCLAENSS